MAVHEPSLKPRRIGILARAFLFAGWTSLASAAESKGDGSYQQWIAPYLESGFVGRGISAQGQSKLSIMAIEGDDEAPGEDRRIDSRLVQYGTDMTSDGRVSGFSRGWRGEKGGGGGPPLAPETLARLDALLAALPDDGSKLHRQIESS